MLRSCTHTYNAYITGALGELAMAEDGDAETVMVWGQKALELSLRLQLHEDVILNHVLLAKAKASLAQKLRHLAPPPGDDDDEDGGECGPGIARARIARLSAEEQVHRKTAKAHLEMLQVLSLAHAPEPCMSAARSSFETVEECWAASDDAGRAILMMHRDTDTNTEGRTPHSTHGSRESSPSMTLSLGLSKIKIRMVAVALEL